MYSKPIGVSILTNGGRLPYLKRCVESFLTHCYYRPLIFGIYNNGSMDETHEWIEDWLLSHENEWKYGITYRVGHSEDDRGCAAGTNAACELVRDCEFALHLESDFEHLSPEESGEDKLWLRRAVEFMQSVDGNYLYLRRMTGEVEMFAHWWSQWMPRVDKKDGCYLSCPTFWWSNNPSLRRNKALYDNGTLPLDESKDGAKGTAGWSVPELTAKAPGKAWIHKWGMFVHDRPLQGNIFSRRSCSVTGEGCKYGFFKDGSDQDLFCKVCFGNQKDFKDMPEHQVRYRDYRGNK